MTDQRSVYALFREWRNHLDDDRRTRLLKEQDDDFDFEATDDPGEVEKQRKAAVQKSRIDPIQSHRTDRYKKEAYKKRMRQIGKSMKKRGIQIELNPRYIANRQHVLNSQLVKHASRILKPEQLPANWKGKSYEYYKKGYGVPGQFSINELPPKVYNQVVQSYIKDKYEMNDKDYNYAVFNKKVLMGLARGADQRGGRRFKSAWDYKYKDKKGKVTYPVRTAFGNYLSKLEDRKKEQERDMGRYYYVDKNNKRRWFDKRMMVGAQGKKMQKLRTAINKHNRWVAKQVKNPELGFAFEKLHIHPGDISISTLKRKMGKDFNPEEYGMGDSGRINIPSDEKFDLYKDARVKYNAGKNIRDSLTLQGKFPQDEDGDDDIEAVGIFANWRQDQRRELKNINKNAFQGQANDYLDSHLIKHITKRHKYDRAVARGEKDLKKPELNIANIFGGGRGAFTTKNTTYKQQLDAAEAKRSEAEAKRKEAESKKAQEFIDDFIGPDSTVMKDPAKLFGDQPTGVPYITKSDQDRVDQENKLDQERRTKYGDDYKSKGSFMRRYRKVGKDFDFANFYDLVDQHGVGGKLGRYGKGRDGKDFKFGGAHARALKALVKKTEKTGEKLPQSIIDAHNAISSKRSSVSRRKPKIKGLKPPTPKAPEPITPVPAPVPAPAPVAKAPTSKPEKAATPPAPKPKFGTDIYGNKVKLEERRIHITENKTVKDIHTNWKNFLS